MVSVKTVHPKIVFFLETVSLNRLNLFSLLSSITFLHILLESKFFEKELLALKKMYSLKLIFNIQKLLMID